MWKFQSDQTNSRFVDWLFSFRLHSIFFVNVFKKFFFLLIYNIATVEMENRNLWRTITEINVHTTWKNKLEQKCDWSEFLVRKKSQFLEIWSTYLLFRLIRQTKSFRFWCTYNGNLDWHTNWRMSNVNTKLSYQMSAWKSEYEQKHENTNNIQFCTDCSVSCRKPY